MQKVKRILNHALNLQSCPRIVSAVWDFIYTLWNTLLNSRSRDIVGLSIVGHSKKSPNGKTKPRREQIFCVRNWPFRCVNSLSMYNYVMGHGTNRACKSYWSHSANWNYGQLCLLGLWFIIRLYDAYDLCELTLHWLARSDNSLSVYLSF